MYNSQDIANRIKSLAKSKDVNLKTLLSQCQLGINTVSQMSKGNDMLSKNLARIADYLGCSVDYLLGRTNNPNNESPTLPEIIYKFEDLSEERKQEILDFIEYKVHQQENDSNS